ncbi:phage tail length tape measure family protein [Intestinirhabdus alba]|jgi:hypothetical protein|uniref:Tail length tape measure protein n=1 Tax=Intestinirhabdus alba TaxID=2899544 RepID=A0A6L6IM53_9ENTR|nr:phage tail length tape measure family protein [Intestinirhabdus alba]MTH47255.1 tail length tape measure protein [Intestinirhabdus alba]
MAGEETVGSIVFEVDMETARLVKGVSTSNRALDEINASLDASIKQFSKLDTQVTETAKGVTAATRSMGSMRFAAGQLGYQIQDVAVQLQMGQNAMMVFAQQGSQIASIFGPGGAVVGAVVAISGAIAGALLPSLFKSKDATAELETAQKALSNTVIKTDAGVTALSEKIQRLAAVSSDAAKAQIAVSMTDAQKAISAAGSAINEQVSDLGTWRNSMAAAQSQLTTLEAKGVDVTAVLKDLGGTYEGNIVGVNILNNVTTDMAETFGITQTQAVGLVKVFRDLSKEPTPEKMQAAAAALSSLSEQTGYANPKLNELTNLVNSNALAAMNAGDAMKVLKEALTSLTGATEASKKALSGNVEQLNRLVEAAKNEAATVGMSSREKAKYVANLLGATEAERQSIDASYDKIEAYQAEQKAQKEKESEDKKAAAAATSAAKKSEAEQQQVINQLDQLANKYQIATLQQQGMGREAAILAAQQQLGAAATQQQVQQAGELAGKMYDLAEATKSAKEEEQKRKESSQNFTQLQGQASPVAAVDNTYAQQMAQLNQYVQLYPQKIAEAEAVRAQIEDQYHQKRMAAMWEEWQQQSEINNMLGAAVDSLQGGATSAITGLINGTQSLQESFANIGTTILNSVVGSLVQMGIEWVKSQLMGQAAAAASLASTMAQATAAASAWAPAAMSASIATYGTAAAVGQAAYAGSLLSAKGMAIAGTRYNGGPVDAGSMYRVGEHGKPEIYQASNGSQYMIPGDNGRVISNRDIGSGGSGVGSVSVVNNFTINTTNGIDQATMNQIGKIAYNQSLRAIRDEQRPNGMLEKSR